MTKKHYELIASALEECKPLNTVDDNYQDLMDQYRTIVENVSSALRLDNQRFDASRFNKACGLVE